MNRITRVSWFFRIIFQIFLILIPMLTIICWLYAPASFQWGGVELGMWFTNQKILVLHPLSLQTRLYGFLLSMITAGLMMGVTYSLVQLFRLYEEKIIFTLKNVQYIKRTGILLLLYEIARPIIEGFTTMLLTWQNPHGHRIATISFTGVNLAVVLTAIMVILISWIMAEGCKLQEEQQFII